MSKDNKGHGVQVQKNKHRASQELCDLQHLQVFKVTFILSLIVHLALLAREGLTGLPMSGQLWQRSINVWGLLSHLPCRYQDADASVDSLPVFRQVKLFSEEISFSDTWTHLTRCVITDTTTPFFFLPELIIICTSLFSSISSGYSVKVTHSFMMPFPINIRLFISRQQLTSCLICHI